MPPETEVISCPACKHLVRVPADWLGQTVQCPECQAKFTAPVRDGDRLTDPVLLSRPDEPAEVRAGRPDSLLWLPAWGLMLVGVVAVAADGYTLFTIARDPAGFEEGKRAQAVQVAKWLGQPPEAVAGNALVRAGPAAGVAGYGVACGLAAFAGGLAMALRRGYRVAQAGCVLAILNLPELCCVPGAVFGLWGLLMLAGEEGRSHFVREGASG
ncbi:MAG: zinc-ribbon domain-containing protein [Gemmataceae bacterium]|nr:zinc-ribbon domain-containing protein [Gemmataceae bacterium]